MTAIEKADAESLGTTKRRAGLPHFLAKHASSPSGLFGKFFGLAMKKMNRDAYEWILDEMGDSAQGVLEVGFGAGYGLKALAERHPKLKIFGIERSPAMLQSATKENREFIEAGRMRLMLASANETPLSTATVSQVFGVHVSYFWKTPVVELKEFFRVLKPAGQLFLFIGSQDEMKKVSMTQTGLYSIHSTEYLTECLISAGFSEILVKDKKVKSGPVNTGICMIARKAGQ